VPCVTFTTGFKCSGSGHDSARDGSFRKIKVETKPEKYHILTRAGYYAPTH